MARYIDADRLRDRVKTETNPCGKPTLEYASGLKVLVMIDKEPSADVVKVVRCKDCLSWKECGIDPITNYHFGYCRHYQWQDKDDSRETNAQDFCSYGWGGDESDA